MQKLIAGVVLIIVLAVVFMRGDQLVELVETVKQGTPLFVVLAVAAQFGKYISQGFGFRECFNTVDEKIDFKTGLSLVFGTFFVNTVAPSLNLAGTSLVVDTSIRHGIPAGKGTSAALFMQLCIDSAFACIMIITFTVLSLTVGLDPGWIAVGALAVLLVGGLAVVMIVGGRRPQLAIRVLTPVQNLINRVLAKFNRKPMDPWVESTVLSFAGAAKLIVKNPKKSLRAFSCSLAASLCEITCFVLAGVSFGVMMPEALVCGYVIATLFAMISITPQGVGMVEAASVVAFGLFGVDSATGLTVIMVYRGIVFWMPFLIGAVVIQLRSRHSK